MFASPTAAVPDLLTFRVQAAAAAAAAVLKQYHCSERKRSGHSGQSITPHDEQN